MNAYDPNPLGGEPIAADDDIDSHNPLVPQITLVNKRDTPALMSKHISLTNDGKLHSDGSKCLMVTGRRPRVCANGKRTWHELSQAAPLIRRSLWGRLKEGASPTPSK